VLTAPPATRETGKGTSSTRADQDQKKETGLQPLGCARVRQTLPSASSGQALSAAFDVDLAFDFVLDLAEISSAAITTVKERLFSPA